MYLFSIYTLRLSLSLYTDFSSQINVYYIDKNVLLLIMPQALRTSVSFFMQKVEEDYTFQYKERLFIMKFIQQLITVFL